MAHAGGDYGKKELSPALSNRFTSIWVPAIEDVRELLAILESRLPSEHKRTAGTEPRCGATYTWRLPIVVPGWVPTAGLIPADKLGRMSGRVPCRQLLPAPPIRLRRPRPGFTGEEAKALIAPRLLDFWRFFRSEAAHAARQALSGKRACLAGRSGWGWGASPPARGQRYRAVAWGSSQLRRAAEGRWDASCRRPPPPPPLPLCPAVRDLLAWAGFIAATAPQLGLLPAYAHGAHLVLLDGIGLGVGMSAEVGARGGADPPLHGGRPPHGGRGVPGGMPVDVRVHSRRYARIQCCHCCPPSLQASQQLRNRCHAFLLTQLPPEVHPAAEAAAGRGALPGDGAQAEAAGMDAAGMDDGQQQGAGRWGIAPFFVEQRPCPDGSVPGARFNFQAPTTGRNALRVLRALQVCAPGSHALRAARSVLVVQFRSGCVLPLAKAWCTTHDGTLRLPVPRAAAAQAHPTRGLAWRGQDVSHCRHGQGSW